MKKTVWRKLIRSFRFEAPVLLATFGELKSHPKTTVRAPKNRGPVAATAKMMTQRRLLLDGLDELTQSQLLGRKMDELPGEGIVEPVGSPLEPRQSKASGVVQLRKSYWYAAIGCCNIDGPSGSSYFAVMWMPARLVH
jgi:hypothetical protein